LIDAGWATLQELRTSWTFADLVDANDMLDRLQAARKPPKAPPGRSR